MKRPMMTDQEWNNMMVKVTQQSNYDQATKLIYQWVKQNRVSPTQMSELSVAACKHFAH